MQINSISNQQPTFGRLISGDNLKSTLAPNRQDLINKYNVIKLYIRHQNLHKMNYADIILDYNNTDGFYGVIKNKSKKAPKLYYNNPCKVNTSENALGNFKSWANEWNERLSKYVSWN